jgi:hypothetical protein
LDKPFSLVLKIAEAQVDQEVATQIKQVEATKWIVTAVLKLVQKWGKPFLWQVEWGQLS